MVKQIIKDILIGNDNYKIEAETSQKILTGQQPKITLVTCSDSRISGHIMNNDMTNKVFHIRNIGNQIENNFGSVDYGIYHLSTPILLILGHTDCGAVKASQIDFSKESDEIRQELYPLHFNLAKTVRLLDKQDPKYISKLVQSNVDKQVELAKKRYGDKTNVVGAIFDIHKHLNTKQGKIIITNINGNTDEFKLKNHELLSELDSELKDVMVNRL
jgi:carbonic anhydrase